MADQGVARFYTRSRRFPKMIGRMTDGSRIPGGPYTLTQVGFGGVALLVLLMTRTMWSTGSVILDLAVTLGVAWGATWVVGLIPMTRRNLLFAFMDAIAAMTKPRGGKYQGQVITLARPHQAVGSAPACASTRPDRQGKSGPMNRPGRKTAVPAERNSAQRAAATAPQPAAFEQLSHPPVSAVERLLQQAKNNH